LIVKLDWIRISAGNLLHFDCSQPLRDYPK
jgi:hypothetical protein